MFVYTYEPLAKIEKQDFCQDEAGIVRSIEDFGFKSEVKVTNFVKLLIFGKMLLTGSADHFPTDLEAQNYIINNKNLNFSSINDKLQKFYLRNRKILFKNIKTLITNDQELEILNNFSKDLDNVFGVLELTSYSSIKNLTPNEKLDLIKQGGFKQVRVLGTNHILMKVQLNNLKEELAILKEEGLLNEKYKILLLCGNHKNNKLFNEDQKKECDHMYELSKAIIPSEVDDDRIILTKSKRFGENKYRPSTVVTIIDADNYLKPEANETLLYSSFSPTFSFRVMTDILRNSNIIKSSANKAIFVNRDQVALLNDLKQQKIDNYIEIKNLYARKKELKFYEIKSKFIINKQIKNLEKDNNVIDKFVQLYYSTIFDNLVRSIYSKSMYFKGICNN